MHITLRLNSKKIGHKPRMFLITQIPPARPSHVPQTLLTHLRRLPSFGLARRGAGRLQRWHWPSRAGGRAPCSARGGGSRVCVRGVCEAQTGPREFLRGVRHLNQAAAASCLLRVAWVQGSRFSHRTPLYGFSHSGVYGVWGVRGRGNVLGVAVSPKASVEPRNTLMFSKIA